MTEIYVPEGYEFTQPKKPMLWPEYTERQCQDVYFVQHLAREELGNCKANMGNVHSAEQSSNPAKWTRNANRAGELSQFLADLQELEEQALQAWDQSFVKWLNSAGWPEISRRKLGAEQALVSVLGVELAGAIDDYLDTIEWLDMVRGYIVTVNRRQTGLGGPDHGHLVRTEWVPHVKVTGDRNNRRAMVVETLLGALREKKGYQDFAGLQLEELK